MAICLFFIRPMTADAATKTYTYTDFIDVNTFDAVTYAAENPDVVVAIGNDPALLFNHYITVGCLEGRKGYSIYPNCTAMLRIMEVIDTHITDDMTEEQKVFAVHEWMTNNIKYGRIKGFSSNPLCNVMLGHYGICVDYSDTFSAFMCLLGIKNKILNGSPSHAWNQVLINGRKYNLDVTWDASVQVNGKFIQRYDPYKYYLFTDSEYAAKEHMLPYNPNGYLCPMICTGADRFSGLFVRIEDDLADPEEYAFFVECGGDKFIY